MPIPSTHSERSQTTLRCQGREARLRAAHTPGGAQVVVQPATMIRWHRAGWRLLWRLKSRAGRPPIPKELREWVARYNGGRCGTLGRLSVSK